MQSANGELKFGNTARFWEFLWRFHGCSIESKTFYLAALKFFFSQVVKNIFLNNLVPILRTRKIPKEALADEQKKKETIRLAWLLHMFFYIFHFLAWSPFQVHWTSVFQRPLIRNHTHYCTLVRTRAQNFSLSNFETRKSIPFNQFNAIPIPFAFYAERTTLDRTRIFKTGTDRSLWFRDFLLNQTVL